MDPVQVAQLFTKLFILPKVRKYCAQGNARTYDDYRRQTEAFLFENPKFYKMLKQTSWWAGNNVDPFIKKVMKNG